MSIRPEGSDIAATLLRVIERRTGLSGLTFDRPPVRLTGGFWADIFAFRLAGGPKGFEGDLVLRLMPAEERARRELCVHATIAAQGFPTPRVHLSGDEAAGFERPFIIMDRARGGSIAAGLPPREKMAATRQVPRLLAKTSAALHKLDPEPVVSRLREGGWSEQSLGVAALLDELAIPVQGLSSGWAPEGLRWLRQHAPTFGAKVPCHGDLHGFNLIIEHGEVSALIDWTNFRIAEPAFDLAKTLLLLEDMPIEVPRLLRPMFKAIGRRAARVFLATYRALTPFREEKLSWYQALHAYQLLVRVADARLPTTATRSLEPSHPWELGAAASAARFQRLTDIGVVLPPYRHERPCAEGAV